jgi:hypothetical protein
MTFDSYNEQEEQMLKENFESMHAQCERELNLLKQA